MAASFPGVSLAAVFQGNNPPYVSAEAVTLTGGAGADWVPTKASQTRALNIGTGGNLKVDMADGSTGVTLVVTAMTEFRISVTKVYNTTDGTTAASIVALY